MRTLLGQSTGPLDVQPGTAQGNRSDGRRERGDSLAIRLPADIVETLGLKEGDEVELRIAGLRTVEIARAIAAERREAALARIKESRWKLPPGWQFDRDEANSR